MSDDLSRRPVSGRLCQAFPQWAEYCGSHGSICASRSAMRSLVRHQPKFPMPMTPKQTRFVAEYLVDLNATQAAIRAGYSARNADKIGPALLGKSRVAAAVALAQAERARRVQVTADEVLAGLKREATLTGPESSHSARVAAWTQLGKHLGLFVDRLHHGGGVVLEIVEEIVEAPLAPGNRLGLSGNGRAGSA